MQPYSSKSHALANQARELFLQHAVQVMPDLAKSLQAQLLSLTQEPGGAREMQDRRDAMLAFQKNGAAWVQGTCRAWTDGCQAQTPAAAPRFAVSDKFQLMDDAVMDEKIIASRLALRLLDFSSWELSDLRLRLQHLQSVSELHKDDIVRPEVLSRHVVAQWGLAGLSNDIWMLLQDGIQKTLATQLLSAYHATNAFLIQQGVMAEIDLRPLVKRTPSAVSGLGAMPSDNAALARPTGPAGIGSTGRSEWGAASTGLSTSQSTRWGDAAAAASAAALRAGLKQQGPARRAPEPSARSSPSSAHIPPNGRGDSSRSARDANLFDETRMQTAATPLARARMRALGVMGQLKRLISDHVVGYEEGASQHVSTQLEQAIGHLQRTSQQAPEATVRADAAGQLYGQTHVDQAMGALRQRTTALKDAAGSSAEKATIEIVALMFQSILAEDRIPPVIRVWFARLQMPVLRVAIAEPEFFSSLQHPARRLIDRMGACALGFDVTLSGGAMEAEVKRIVQVIEQYPETGRRVFQLVYDEFEKFISKFLSEQGSTARVVSVAQQLEQKETMAIQYTIEMRKMLNDMPVRDEIREFLFKTWAEVLAISAIKNGSQHEQTLTFKRACSDLVWAASAKPNREDRARVIAELPKLLALLRSGMSLLGLDGAAQDAHLKAISDTLADAFMSKTPAISMEQVQAMAQRLSNLEDYLSDEDVGDLPLDAEALITMLGLDAGTIEVITDGGSQPTEAMRAWAQELQLGDWFSLDHNGHLYQVQFAWCSGKKQLHLFAALDGRTFLLQARRLAAYLQAGLLLPTEEESLTVRATRDALTKLDANPERLLG